MRQRAEPADGGIAEPGRSLRTPGSAHSSPAGSGELSYERPGLALERINCLEFVTASRRVALIRLWIAGTALFVIAVASMSYSHLKQEFDAVAVRDRVDHMGIVLPQLCRDARGVPGLDYSTQKGREPGHWDVARSVKASEKCWYASARFRQLYPEFDKLSNKDLMQKLYTDVGEPISNLRNPWAALWTTASIAFGIPLLLLGLGAFLLWAMSMVFSRRL
jgi:hypothetical protein